MRCSKLLHNSARVCGSRNAGRWVVLACALVVGGCNGAQSALDPAGREAERIAHLFWWMVAGAVIVWLSVVGLTVYSVRARPELQNQRRAGLLIIGGGAVVPTVVLAVLLAYGLSMLPDLVAPAPEGSLKISVTGEQWWWRVRYEPHGAEVVVLANEIRLPVGEPVEFWLESADVIHSFWIPPLGGKIDMIPGRLTRIALVPTKTGVFRGVCAEYCGTSHALMSFYVEVLEKEEFDRWLAHQSAPAERAADPLAARGQDLFLAQGCSACHTVRGTPASGVIGPDLTHVGSRLSLGAGILPNEPDTFLQWIAHTQNAKPGVQMPNFGMLPPDELRALAAYLEGLK
ncbi:MAG TPA: cytochrome c oxidase subunit II [Blastocatellia bacterium]|nr:cytochrome c oxidase subunit II [Blastocatellia bacterium]